MYVEGFERLRRTVTASRPTSDPVEDLLAAGRAYRRAALRSPHLYVLMFGKPVPGFEPSGEARAVAARSFQPVVAGVVRCNELGAFRSDVDAEDAAYHLWGLAHGLVELEIHRTLPSKRADFERRYSARPVGKPRRVPGRGRPRACIRRPLTRRRTVASRSATWRLRPG